MRTGSIAAESAMLNISTMPTMTSITPAAMIHPRRTITLRDERLTVSIITPLTNIAMPSHSENAK